MAKSRYGTVARVDQRCLRLADWIDTISTGRSKQAKAQIQAQSIHESASQIVGKPFNPGEFVLSHVTIVSSVTTEPAPKDSVPAISALLGGGFDPRTIFSVSGQGGFQPNRVYPDYRITRNTQKFINDNNDAFSQGVLKKSYRTFVGAENFLEHVQVAALSKGKILDSALRDVGESFYVDILVATDKFHEELCAAILDGTVDKMSMGCFVPGTQVTMGDGRRTSIEDIQPGDKVLTHRGRPRKVKNKQIRYGAWTLKHIEAVGLPDPISATNNHPFYVLRAHNTCQCGCGEGLPTVKGSLNSKSVMFRKFKAGHDKRIFNHNSKYSQQERLSRRMRLDGIPPFQTLKLRADELQLGDMLIFPRPKKVERGKVSKERARLLGFYLSEGYLFKPKGKVASVCFAFSILEKDTYVKEVVDLLSKEFPGDVKPWVQVRKKKNLCVVHFSNRLAADWFSSQAGEFSQYKFLSSEVVTDWSDEEVSHLLGGWFCGDGGKTLGEGLYGTTVSYPLVCQLHLLLSRIGCYGRIEVLFNGKCVNLSEVVKRGLHVRDEQKKLPVYRLQVGNGFSYLIPTDKASVPYRSSRFRVTEDFIVFPVTEITTEKYVGPVHNMEVEEDHTYIAGGASVSNCDIVGSQCSCCGHWSTDDSNLCPCIRNFKGQNFIDLDGRPSRIGELCGHESIDPTGGVTFKEASWVEGPAFKGAVSRDILVPPDETKPHSWHHMVPSNWEGQTSKLASKRADEFGLEEPSDSEAESPSETNPLDDAVQQVQRYIYERAVSQIRDRMEKKNVQDKIPGAPNENDNIVKQASIRVAKSFVEGVRKHASLYRQGRYEDFLVRCGLEFRRPLTRMEAEVAFRIAKKFNP